MLFKRFVKNIIFLFVLSSSARIQAQNTDTTYTIPDTCLYLPNTLTPDCDQYGCQFLKVNFFCTIKEYKIEIYNKYGELLHESTDIDEVWDPETVIGSSQLFAWIITGKMFLNNEEVKVEGMGHINYLK